MKMNDIRLEKLSSVNLVKYLTMELASVATKMMQRVQVHIPIQKRNGRYSRPLDLLMERQKVLDNKEYSYGWSGEATS